MMLTLGQPSGEPATIKWVTVGGRTSAYVEELQKPTGLPPRSLKALDDMSSQFEVGLPSVCHVEID